MIWLKSFWQRLISYIAYKNLARKFDCNPSKQFNPKFYFLRAESLILSVAMMLLLIEMSNVCATDLLFSFSDDYLGSEHKINAPFFTPRLFKCGHSLWKKKH